MRRLGEHFVQRGTDCAESDLDSLPSAQNVTLCTKCSALHNPHAALVRATSIPDSPQAGSTLPGGRLEHGETLKTCLLREFAEEVGMAVMVHDQILAGENFFTRAGRTVHSIEFYHAISADPLPDEPPRPREPDLEFAWVGAEDLSSLRPEFIIDILKDLLGSDAGSRRPHG